ncbi:MAG: hypothetical protein JXQ73_25110 [Phycisphaerae bacterium]|nr:hypothetical protein [Phycisphaerae bacterium]
MKIAFIDKSFSASTLQIITLADAIIQEYLDQGFRLTLRQLYYQFVARDLIPNRQQEYKRLGSIINDARLSGDIDWDAIEDRGRNLQRVSTWDGPDDIVRSAAEQFKLDLWSTQTRRPEVWIEKEALLGVIAGTCGDLRVPYFACKGYTSASELFEAGYRRFRRHLEDGQEPVVIHLGDHDPSGIDMTRDLFQRLSLFLGEEIEVKRIALNWDQVEAFNPPPNPVKFTDSRSNGYVDRFGEESWELDALEPTVLGRLIRDTVGLYRDDEAWAEMSEREEAGRLKLAELAKELS